MEIDESLIPDELKVTNEDGSVTIDFSKMKTQKDIDNLTSALEKRVTERNNEIAKLKTRLQEHKSETTSTTSTKSADFLALQNQFNELKSQFEAEQQEKIKLQNKVVESEFKDFVLKDKDVNKDASTEFFNRVNREGFTKTEVNGKIDWINNKNGKSVNQFINELKTTEKFWFNGSKSSTSNLSYEDAEKKNDIRGMIQAKRASR